MGFLTLCLFFCSQRMQKWSLRKVRPPKVARLTVVWIGLGFNPGNPLSDALTCPAPSHVTTGLGYKFWKTRNFSD